VKSEADPLYDWLMTKALRQAACAQALGDVPIGAVIARGRELIAEAHNRRHIDKDPTAHAELLAIRQASQTIGDWRLTGCTLVVTLEPCCMCAGAIVLARIDTLVYGAADPKAGAVDSLYHLCGDRRLNHRVNVVAGVLAEQAGQLLTQFFLSQREMGKK